MANEGATVSKRPLLTPAVIAAVMLVGAFGSWPYGYYQALRVVTFIVAIVFAVHGYTNGRTWSAWVFGFIAVIFNPVLPLRLSRGSWQPIDLIVAALFVVAAAAMPTNGTRGLAER
jgi:hypothetical protein